MSLSVETFEDELVRRLGREYRVRWSPRKETYCIEQQVGTAKIDIPRAAADIDTWQRAKDGYGLVCEISPRTMMKCLQCRTRLAVPELKWGEVKCDTCRSSKNYNTAVYYVAYFPLCERLLQHLESTSPKRGWAWVQRLKDKNTQVRVDLDRRLSNHLESGFMDYRNVIGGVPRVGYGRGPVTFGKV
jgi:hypothetical protein